VERLVPCQRAVRVGSERKGKDGEMERERGVQGVRVERAERGSESQQESEAKGGRKGERSKRECKHFVSKAAVFDTFL
jgi:hypothetical protein